MEVAKFIPIGRVRNEAIIPRGEDTIRHEWGNVVSDLVVDETFTDALDGIEDYSHVVVISWLQRAAAPKAMKKHVQNRQELPVVGIFSTRAPIRPNAIGLSAVPIIAREGNVLTVKGLDAIDGTPILDLKPYTPAFDRMDNVRIPPWVTVLYEQEDYF